MTNASYTTMLQSLKSSRTSIGGWEVIADGDVYQFADHAEAIQAAHDLQGRLYKVIADQDAPHGFRRIPESPSPQRKRDIQRTLEIAGAETFAQEMKSRRRR